MCCSGDGNARFWHRYHSSSTEEVAYARLVNQPGYATAPWLAANHHLLAAVNDYIATLQVARGHVSARLRALSIASKRPSGKDQFVECCPET